MAWLIAGLVLFLGAHSVQIFVPGARSAAIARLGEGPWKGLYTLVSLVGFGLIIYGYGQARGGDPVYALPPGLRHLTFLLVTLGFIGVGASHAPRNAIKYWIGDPMVFGVGCWALGHLLANATPAALVLFGSFLVWAMVDYISLRRRAHAAPVAAETPTLRATLIVVVTGVILSVVFAVWLHRWLIGVSPMG